jgi:hypothetical protein
MPNEQDSTTNPFETMDGLTSFMSGDSIDGHHVKEWSTTQFSHLYPYLAPLTKTLMEAGATYDNLGEYLRNNYPKLIDAVVPHMVPIILISCPTVTEEYLETQPFTRGMEFITLIFQKNISHVADFFGQKASQLEGLAKEETKS